MNEDKDEIEVDDIAADVRAAAEEVSTRALGDKLATEAPSASDAPEVAQDRPRDASGKFTKVEAPVEAAPEPVTDADRPGEQLQQQSNALSPPTSWSADAKATWSNLPPAAQQAALKREAEMADGQRQWSERENVYRQALAPVSPLAQQYKMPEDEVINRLVLAEQRLQRDAPNAIIELAQAYGVDLRALVNGSPQPQRQQPSFDPNTITQTVRQQIAAEFENRAVESTISDFGAAKDANGQPAHPHFEAVKAEMGFLLQSGKAQTMQDAYDKAIWMYAEMRPQPQVQVPSQQQVQKAKRANVSVTGAPQNGQTSKANGFDASTSTRDDVREAIRMLQH